MMEEKQREYYRLTYPQSYRPVLTMDFDQYEVEDISEYGIKLKVDADDPTFMLNDHVMAIIKFPDGREFDLSGRVVRTHDGCVGLALDTALPLSLIRSESLYVLYNFPSQ